MKATKHGRRPLRPDDKDQSKLFIEKVRETEADEKYSAADKFMERLAKTEPEPHSSRKPG